MQPPLAPTGWTARIVWLGLVADRGSSLTSVPVQSLDARFGGIPGDSHFGTTRKADGRVAAQYARGTPIRNTRELSIVSREELDAIAAEMHLPALDAAWLGATMMVEGLPDFTLLPPSARLQVEGAGTTLVVDMENHPCALPAREIENRHPGKGALFRKAAARRRGLTAWVEREGCLQLGDVLRLHLPTQPPWPHEAGPLHRAEPAP